MPARSETSNGVFAYLAEHRIVPLLPHRMPIVANVWNEAFRVRAYEVDPSGFASIQTLCNFLQEAAGNHAQMLGVSVGQLAEENLTWVLSRLHVLISRFPRWRDTVQVETWPSGVEGLYARREFLVYDDGPEPIARGTSAWLMFDLNRRRPVRLTDVITEIITPDRPRPIHDPPTKLTAPTRIDHRRRFTVRYSDLDVNWHVNNVRYVEWAVETLPQEILKHNRLASIEVTFRAETTYGDTVIGEAEQLDAVEGLAFSHRVLREGEDREVAVVLTRWLPA